MPLKKSASPQRNAWKIVHRLMRITRRETEKAFVDSVIYGQGFMRIADGEPRHVPFAEVRSAS